jgi:hypothetical protein
MGIPLGPAVQRTIDNHNVTPPMMKQRDRLVAMINKDSSAGGKQLSVIDVEDCLRRIRAWLREPENQLLAALSLGLFLAWEILVALAMYNLLAGGPLN